MTCSADNRHYPPKEDRMISELIHRLEQSLAYARAIQKEVDGDPDTWSDERWEEMHKGFEHAFSLAVAEAQREEMWPPSKSNPTPDRLMVPSLERAEAIIEEWAGVPEDAHSVGGQRIGKVVGWRGTAERMTQRPKSG
jgi:hypothetical protein